MPSVSSMPCLARPCRSGAQEVRQHFTLRVGTPPRERSRRRAVVLGVDQAQVEVARAVVRDVLDLAPDPEMPVPGKGLVERAFDLLVDAPDGVDAAAVLGLGPAAARSGASEAAASGGASGSKS